MAPLEIRALAKIIDELDYYQILHLKPAASASEVKKAYFACSRSFHADANRHLEMELRDQCHLISKRITEAYCVLRDPRKRKVYDGMRGGEDSQVRLQIAEARAAHARQDSDARQGTTPQGRQFLQRAMLDISSENWAGAINNLQMALTFEPNNSLFKEELEAAKKAKKARC